MGNFSICLNDLNFFMILWYLKLLGKKKVSVVSEFCPNISFGLLCLHGVLKLLHSVIFLQFCCSSTFEVDSLSQPALDVGPLVTFLRLASA